METMFGGATAAVYVHLIGVAERQSLAEMGPSYKAALERTGAADCGVAGNADGDRSSGGVSLVGRLVLKKFPHGIFCGEVRLPSCIHDVTVSHS
jgi:hypothetical protein